MAMKLNDQNGSEEKVEIKLNRKMRTWNRYKNYVIIGGGILVIVILLILILRGCSSDKDSKDKETTTAQMTQTTAAQQNTQETTTAQEVTTAPQTTTAAPQTGSSVDVSGTAGEAEFVGKDKFTGVTFLGDSIVSGFAYYGYLDEGTVISDGNLTSDKLTDYTSAVAATNPSKVVIMVGLNDLNYGTRGADTIAGYISDFTTQLKSSVPSAQVYVLSVLPVTSGFEASGNVNITQSGIDELNTLLSSEASSKGYTYVNVSSAFKDGTGYMNGSYTGNGSNIYNEYYPFLLNGIAGVLK